MGLARWRRVGRHQCPADDLRHFSGRRGVAAALGADDAVDDGHADAGEVAELHAFEDVLAGGVLRLVHQDEIGGAADFDDAAIELAHAGGVAGRQARTRSSAGRSPSEDSIETIRKIPSGCTPEPAGASVPRMTR